MVIYKIYYVYTYTYMLVVLFPRMLAQTLERLLARTFEITYVFIWKCVMVNCVQLNKTEDVNCPDN